MSDHDTTKQDGAPSGAVSLEDLHTLQDARSILEDHHIDVDTLSVDMNELAREAGMLICASCAEIVDMSDADEGICLNCANTPSASHHLYLLVMYEDVEPELLGPYDSEKARTAGARAQRADHGDRDGLFRLDVPKPATHGMTPIVNTFTNGELAIDEGDA